MKQYSGRREGYAVIVTVDGRRLNPRLDLWNHSPTGFEWGYGGSGPAQLALAILADHCRNDEQAVSFHQRFKWAVIAALPHRSWEITTGEIERVLQELQEPIPEGAL
ncbi:MAG: DUF6166 domain-containing protein [Candidatus Pacebacteria bacterium]|nr:DUF6166 domain-containing protein [Candidatus Paceibacterota bacterium]